MQIYYKKFLRCNNYKNYNNFDNNKTRSVIIKGRKLLVEPKKEIDIKHTNNTNHTNLTKQGGVPSS
jgi:hypothetical protein